MTASATLSISGALTEDDVQRLTKEARTASGLLGPTTVYYAGVTAPAISAGMGLLMREALLDAGFDAYWTNLSSAMVAAMAGIAWYMIFIRWSKRNKVGRASDFDSLFDLEAGPDQLVLRRDHVETRIDWPAVRGVRCVGDNAVVFIHGASPIIVPAAWFEGDEARRRDFISTLKTRAGL